MSGPWPLLSWLVGEERLAFPSCSQPDYCLRPARERVQHCMDLLRRHTFAHDLPAHNHFLDAGGGWTLWGQGMTQETACALCGEPFYPLTPLTTGTRR